MELKSSPKHLALGSGLFQKIRVERSRWNPVWLHLKGCPGAYAEGRANGSFPSLPSIWIAMMAAFPPKTIMKRCWQPVGC